MKEFIKRIGEAFGLVTSEHEKDFLDRYKFLREVGSGAMGSVYLAEQKKEGKRMAIKEQIPETEEDRVRIQKEIDAGTTIDHPNVCRIHAYQVKNGTYYLLQDYIDGLTLRTRLHNWTIEQGREAPFLELRTYLNVFERVVGILQAIHEKEFLHLDIKPENILMKKNDQAVERAEEQNDEHHQIYEPFLIDFGISINQSESVENLKGTLLYMAPEAAGVGSFNRKQIGPRTDIYSLGATMYELATGRPPQLPAYFSGTEENWYELRRQYLQRPEITRREEEKKMLFNRIKKPVDFTGFPYRIEMKEILKTCLQIPIQKRYPNTHMIQQDLRELKESI